MIAEVAGGYHGYGENLAGAILGRYFGLGSNA